MTADLAFQQCIHPRCGSTYDVGQAVFACTRCGGLLDVQYQWDRVAVPRSLAFFNERRAAVGYSAQSRADRSGVWRFRELLPFADVHELVTQGEGRTLLQKADALARAIGHNPRHLYLQYEGFNPSGSFKDNGMAAAFTVARRLGCRRVACASTGNTSAAMALYASAVPDGERIEAVVFVGGGKIAFGKLAQALDCGARTLQIDGDFDTCMSLVQASAGRLGLYLMNSVNPFRLEGQKTIMYRVLEGLSWEVPDWIVVPGGNLGNSSAFGKAFRELKELGLVDRIPRLAIINAAGANSLHTLVNERGIRFNGGAVDEAEVGRFFSEMEAAGRKARTVASAIEIGRPVNLPKALRSIEWMDGIVHQVTDAEILDAKALVGRYGFGCEPASGASVAGLCALLQQRVISPDDRVVCILTGHGLKDPNATVDYHAGSGRWSNAPIKCAADLDAIERALDT